MSPPPARRSSSRAYLHPPLAECHQHIIRDRDARVPATIIAETSLSFLGVGMLPPR